MAIPGRRNGHDLIADLKEQPYRFRFFQAMRLLVLAEKSAGRPAHIPKGLRFRTPASLGFPASEIGRFATRGKSEPSDSIQDQEDTQEPEAQEMEVNFMGLTGPSGVLPNSYTELVIDRKFSHRDTTIHAFFDIFNHRLITLFHGAWEKYRFFVGYEQGKREGFTKHLMDMLGTSRPAGSDLLEGLEAGKPGESGRPSVPPQILAFFAGSLSRRPLPSSSMVSLLSSYFGVKVELEQFAGQWVEASDAEQTCMGKGNCTLGRDTLVGQRMWDQQTKIRLRIGPLSQTQFAEFQPGRSAAIALRQLVETCIGQSLNCDVNLVLDKNAISQSVMKADAEIPLRLGLNVWMRSHASERDFDDVSFKVL